MWEEGGVKVRGQEGQEGAGVDTGGSWLGLKLKGNGEGVEELKAEGFLWGYELGFEGGLEYEGLGIRGALRVGRGGEEIKGRIGGKGGKYGLSMEDGALVGLEYGM